MTSMAATLSSSCCSLILFRPNNESSIVGRVLRPPAAVRHRDQSRITTLPISISRRRRRLQYCLATTSFCRSHKAPDAVQSVDEQHLPRSGALVLMEALRREGVTDVFTTRDQAVAIEALREDSVINTHVFLSPHSEVSAAMGYAMATGLPGVCFACLDAVTSRSEFKTLVERAYKYKIPILVILADGWEKYKFIRDPSAKSKDYGRFLDDLVKLRFGITSGKEIPKVVRAALFAARSGIPGPIVIDQISDDIPIWDLDLVSVAPRRPTTLLLPTTAQLQKVISLLKKSKKPLLFVEHGCLEWSKELARFVELTGIPVLRHDTLIYLVERVLDYRPFILHHFDLLLSFGIRPTFFYENIPSRVHSSIFHHIDEDVPMIGFWDCEEQEAVEEMKIIPGSTFSIGCGDMKSMIERLNLLLLEEQGTTNSGNVAGLDFSAWRKEFDYEEGVRLLDHRYYQQQPLPTTSAADHVHHLLKDIAIRGDASFLINNDATSFKVRYADWFSLGPPVYLREHSYQWLNLPLSAGAAIGTCKDEGMTAISVIHIYNLYNFRDEDFSELSFLKANNIPLKVVIMNHPMEINNVDLDDIPDVLSISGSLGIPCRRIMKQEVSEAIKTMMETPGPYILDVILAADPPSPYFEKQG